MKIFAVQAWRNLWRHKRRTVLTILMLWGSTLLFILSMGMLEGFAPQLIEEYAQTLNGHLVIQRPDYLEEQKPELLIDVDPTFEEFVNSHPLVKAWTKRIILRGILGSASGIRGIKLLGVDPDLDRKMLKVYRHLKRGRAPKVQEKRGPLSARRSEIMIGSDLAKKLELDVGSKAVLKIGLIGEEGAVDIPVKVSGIVRSGSFDYDSLFVFIHLKELYSILNVRGKVHQYAVALRDYRHLPEFVSQLKSKFKNRDWEITPWWELSPDINGMIKLLDISAVFMLFLILPIVLLGTLNTMWMSVLERTRELGILKALGVTGKQIIFLIALEAVALGVLGVGLGTASGWGLNAYLQSIGGLSFKPFLPENINPTVSGISLEPVMHIANNATVILFPTISCFLTVIFGAVFPARRAAKMPIPEAIAGKNR